MTLEDLLQLREAGIADRLGESDESRGLDAGELRDPGGGAEGDLARVVEREDGDLFQPPREPVVMGDEMGLERLKGCAVRSRPRATIVLAFLNSGLGSQLSKRGRPRERVREKP